MKLTKHQKKQLTGAVKLAARLEGHCVVIGETYYWVRSVDVIADSMGDADRRRVRIFLRSEWIINSFGVIKRYPKTILTYRALAYIDGKLYQHAPKDSEEPVDFEVCDNEKETLPKQWFAKCPHCGKRHLSTWIRQGYHGAKEHHPRPPDRWSQDRVECEKCGTASHYQEWLLELAPRHWLFTPEKPVALKGVKS